MRFLCLAFLSLTLCRVTLAADLHVAPNGNDDHDGSAGAPFRSLEKARGAARSLRKANPDAAINIFLHPGTHTTLKTVAFGPEDAGTDAAPLNIRNWHDPANPAARPVLVGGAIVGGWRKSAFNGRADVFEADLQPLSIITPFRQVYLNGRRLTWARYPNEDPALPYSGGWAYVAGVRPPMYKDIEDERTDTVVLRPQDARAWSRPQEGEVCIFPRYNWWNRIEKIAGYDLATRTLTLAKKMQYAARPEDRFCVMGMREELDAPGEWWQDVDNQKLYLIPPAGTDLSTATVTVPTVNDILTFSRTSHVLVSGLELTCAEQCAIRFIDCDHVAVEKCAIHDLGYFHGSAIALERGKHGAVRGCDIWHIGGHGVSLSGGDPVKMEHCGHVVENCYIHHVGQFNRHGIGVMLHGGAGIRVAHNLIHDMPRCGIFHAGVQHTIEYNRIRHCNLEMEDTGCTYTGGWSGGWQTIRYNHCTDSIGFNNHGKFFVFAWGIYLDESGCGNDVYGNIVERCQVGAMHLHNARENHIYNNIFANNAGPQGQTCQLSLQTWNNSPEGLFLRDRQPNMLKEHERLMANPAWAAMRGMHVSPADPFLPDGTIMRGNVITRNIFYYPAQPDSRYIRENGVNLQSNTINSNIVWNGGAAPVKTGRKAFKPAAADPTAKDANATEWEAWQMAGADTHSIVADPLFVDAANGDFTLKPDSPALKLGFEPIPFHKIGPYQDETRATWPIREAEGVRENPHWLTSVPLDAS